MGNGEKSKVQPEYKSKLFKLKEWLTVPEAARHLSNLFGEAVSEADVLRLALDGHLKLSVNFVNHAKAKRGGRFRPFNEWEKDFRSKCSWENLEAIIGPKNTVAFHIPGYDFVYYTGKPSELNGLDEWDKSKLKNLKIDFLGDFSSEQQTALLTSVVEMAIEIHKNKSERFEGKVPPSTTYFQEGLRSIEGVWDLPLLGGERIDIEYKYQQLTDGPDVTLTSMDGTFVETQDGQVWALQEKLDKEFLENQYGEDWIKKSLDWYAETLKKKISNNEIDAAEAKKLLEQRKQNLNKPINHSDYYYPAGGLPDDSVLVVRTSALLTLHERVNEEHAGARSSNTLTPSERKSLIKMVFAMAVDCYGYDPNDKKSPVTQDIIAAVSKADMSISADTVRKWLREGATLSQDDF